MYTIALKMLFGDKIKFITLVAGLTFASLLIVQQGSIFIGLMKRFAVMVTITQAPIWVMDQDSELYDVPNPIADTRLQEVRSIKGVKWAMPYLLARIGVQTFSGKQSYVQFVGVDANTLMGMPQKTIDGNIKDLSLPDAVAIDQNQLDWLGNLKVGETFEINEHRAKLVAILDMPRNAYSYPTIYTTYDKALNYMPPQRKLLCYILVQPDKGISKKDLAERIQNQTGLKAVTDNQFYWDTIMWFIDYTAIPTTFGFTILLGLIVGASIAAQTFYTFTLENLRHFATLKAIGASNRTLVKMLLVQSFVVGFLGYSLGLGLATLFGWILPKYTVMPYFTSYELLLITFVAIVGVCLFASFFSIIRVIKVEPAIVFRG